MAPAELIDLVNREDTGCEQEVGIGTAADRASDPSVGPATGSPYPVSSRGCGHRSCARSGSRYHIRGLEGYANQAHGKGVLKH